MLSSVAERAGLGDSSLFGLDAYLTKPVRESRLADCLCLVLGPAPATGPSAALPGPRRPVTDESLSESSFRSRPRVLLVEDNAVNQRVAARMLERLGCAVDVAGDGREALAALARGEYRVVLMDCQMPHMDGYEAARALRRSEDGARAHVPIVALTANAMPGDVERCLAAGMDDYLAKPVRLEELKRVLERWLKKPRVAG